MPSFTRLFAALVLPALAATVAAQDWAKTRLEASPRHREYVSIPETSAVAGLPARKLQAFVVYPEVKAKAPVVVLIHEIFGLSDWAKEMADELAAQGYIVVAPDLLTGAGPSGGNSDSFPSMDATTKAVSGLDASQVTADLDAAADYGRKLPAANGKLFVAGFCWGGGKTFAFATHRHDLAAAFVFYGPGPADVMSITAPVYGFYAGNDARIGATLPATTDAMKAAGKTFDPVTYDGAGHGFMRAGEAPDASPENKKAREQALAKMLALMKSSTTAHIASSAGQTRSASVKPLTVDKSCHTDASAAVPALQ